MKINLRRSSDFVMQTRLVIRYFFAGALFAALTPFFSASAASSLTLTKGNTTLLASSSVFGGIVHDGSQLVVSYAKGNDLYVRPYDAKFNALAAEKKVTSGGNYIDHKHIFFNNAHYLVYSTLDEKDLYLIKLDTNFVQSGLTVAVTQGSTTTKTNDMLLATDGTNIITGQFRPSNLNGNQTTGHLLKRYDTNLNYISPDITLNKFEHTNTAALLKVGSYMTLVAPSAVVQGGQVSTQRDLLLMRFDTSFNAVDSAAKKIVDSSTYAHANGEGFWMSTGLAYDAASDKIIVGHTFMEGTAGSDKGRIQLRVFDGTSFAQTYTETMVDSAKANRAHFVLHNDSLFVVYDDSTSGAPTIYGLSYALTRSTATGTSAVDCLFNWAEDGYPSLFAPRRPTTQTFGEYTLRYYPQTITYLGISNSNAHLYYYAPTSSSSAMLDLGLAATWKTQAGCSQ